MEVFTLAFEQFVQSVVLCSVLESALGQLVGLKRVCQCKNRIHPDGISACVVE
jgi:hypothetical protein